MSKQRPTFLSYRCDECGKYPIQKYRWECNVCEDFDMCTACYEGGVHDKSHDCTQHVIQTRKVVPTATRASLSGSSKSKQKPKASDKPKPKAKAKDASASSASAQPGTGKAQQVRNLYDSLGLSRRKIGTNRLELFLSLYNVSTSGLRALLTMRCRLHWRNGRRRRALRLQFEGIFCTSQSCC